MATTRKATTHWEGSLFEGAGKVTLESSGLGTYDVSWPARTEEAGTAPTSLDTSADVEFTPGTGITGIKLTVRGVVEGMSNDDFVEAAEAAKTGCPVSQALTGTTITLDAALA